MAFLALYAAGLLLLVVGLFRLLAGRGGAFAGLALALGLAATAGGAVATVAFAPRTTLLPGEEPTVSESTKDQGRLGEDLAEAEPPAEEPARAPEPQPEPEPQPQAQSEPAHAPRVVELPSPAEKPAPPAAPSPAETADFVDPLTQDALEAAESQPPIPVPPPDEQRAVQLAALAGNATAPEKAFIEALARGREAYDAAADDVAREAARADRSAQLCGAVSSPEVENWVAAVEAMETDPSGRIALAVVLPDGTILRTWNNPMSDLDDQTLILPDTELARAIDGLAHGDPVRISGSLFPEQPDCWRSSRLSIDQAIREPSFIFRFTKVERLKNG